jgi:outer membrane protein
MLNLKVDIKECVNYALENNISVKQTELDISSIDKKAAIGNFLPSNANASFLEYWFEPRYHNN